ncbi:MAG: aspartyl protease family protein [Flavobacteriaceae bacterium]|nr:aspartyl protease family protein [Flavobacteriaceae bacterium]
MMFSQGKFLLPKGQEKDKIKFELLNNLVVVPVEVNGKELTFILDTGARNSMLFSLSEIDSIEVKNVSPIKIRGFGTGGTVNALKSSGNKIQIGDAVDNNHTLYIIFDESINFSPRMGIPIHGILGYDFFKDFIVKTNYTSEELTIFNPNLYTERNCKKCVTLPIFLKENKPYLNTPIVHDNDTTSVTLLIDSGASDALWLFNESWSIKENPKNYFDDFLGLGLSGGIFGKRAKLDGILFGNYSFESLNVSFPEREALQEIVLFDERDGSIGGELLKRFTTIIDYSHGKIILQKNRFYKTPFHYNMAGLVVEHDGLVSVGSFSKSGEISLEPGTSSANNAIEIRVNPILNFFLAPRYIIAEVREGSPAAMAGIQKGDEVIAINNKPAYKFKLFEITELFTSKSNRKIFMEIKRNGKILKMKFLLKEVI